MYLEEAGRKSAQPEFLSIDEYLASLEMKIAIHRFEPFELLRIAELLQRSNQFNLRTRRYGQTQCRALMESTDAFPFYAKLKDRYGDYGLIAAVILKREGGVLRIDEWAMSCRVLQRGVEHSLMNAIVDFAKKNGFDRIAGSWAPTAKNESVKDLYAQFGFIEDEPSSDGERHWKLHVGDYVPSKTFVKKDRAC
jgi:FkbH-like protein